MKLEVIEIKDLEGGGAELILDMDEEAKLYLINEGFISAVEKGLARVKELHKDMYKDPLDKMADNAKELGLEY